jgi:hypothetical protein
MIFIPAGEVIGTLHQVRCVTIVDARDLPDGEYVFLDHYCNDPQCDCRKTIIQVEHNGELVSVINFGWETPEYYTNWMGADPDDEMARQMAGASIDMTSPDIVSPQGMLKLFNALLNERWMSNFKSHYAAVKASLAEKEYAPD